MERLKNGLGYFFKDILILLTLTDGKLFVSVYTPFRKYGVFSIFNIMLKILFL